MSARNQIIFLFVFAYGAEASLAQSTMRDVVYLKNGSIVKGIIVEQVPDVSFKIRTNDGNVFVFRFDAVEKIMKEEYNPPSARSVSNGKSPFLAGVLSLVLPGAGQIYNGDTFWGIVHAGLYAGGVVTALTLGFDTDYQYQRTGTRRVTRYNIYTGQYEYYYEPEYGYVYVDIETEFLYIGLGVAGMTLIWSVIDAIVSASDHDELATANTARGATITLVPQKQGFRAIATVNF